MFNAATSRVEGNVHMQSGCLAATHTWANALRNAHVQAKAQAQAGGNELLYLGPLSQDLHTSPGREGSFHTPPRQGGAEPPVACTQSPLIRRSRTTIRYPADKATYYEGFGGPCHRTTKPPPGTPPCVFVSAAPRVQTELPNVVCGGAELRRRTVRLFVQLYTKGTQACETKRLRLQGWGTH
jgi:hypothetical protein